MNKFEIPFFQCKVLNNKSNKLLIKEHRILGNIPSKMKSANKKKALTVNEADHEVSPLSDDAVQVYNPESLICKSEIKKKN